jgi:hypothetical protein
MQGAIPASITARGRRVWAGKVGMKPDPEGPVCPEESLLALCCGSESREDWNIDIACAALGCGRHAESAENTREWDQLRSREMSFKGPGCEPMSKAGFEFLLLSL